MSDIATIGLAVGWVISEVLPFIDNCRANGIAHSLWLCARRAARDLPAAPGEEGAPAPVAEAPAPAASRPLLAATKNAAPRY